jgi:hypothetical protein
MLAKYMNARTSVITDNIAHMLTIYDDKIIKSGNADHKESNKIQTSATVDQVE